MKFNAKFVVLICLIAVGCKNDEVPKGTPECVKNVINRIQNQAVSNPPSKVFRYLYKGKIVYYVPPICCDIRSTLFDEDCNVLCSPDGGFSGGGDEKCADFFASRLEEKLIWQDARK